MEQKPKNKKTSEKNWAEYKEEKEWKEGEKKTVLYEKKVK